MNTIIKISIAAFLLIALNTKAQHSTKFKEFNAGVFLEGLDEDMFVFPGVSFLWGKTTYFSNNLLLDYEYGFALPTLITGKIGLGIGNSNNTMVLGVRPFPSSGYLQYTRKEKHLFSIENMIEIWEGGGIIINYGYRW